MAILSLSALFGALQLFSNVVQSAPIASTNNTQSVVAATTFWLPQIQKQGVAAFGKPGYVVYRNVKDYGAKGDGESGYFASFTTITNRLQVSPMIQLLSMQQCQMEDVADKAATPKQPHL